MASASAGWSRTSVQSNVCVRCRHRHCRTAAGRRHEPSRRRGRRSPPSRFRMLGGNWRASLRHSPHLPPRGAAPRRGRGTSQCRRPFRSGALRNTPTGSSGLASSTGQRAASSAVTWRGLPGTKTKPAYVAGRAARTSSTRFNPHSFDPAENRARAPPRPGSRRASAMSRPGTLDPGASRSTSARVEMPNSETSMRSGANRASRSVVARSMLRSRRSRLLMPISGAPSASARRISPSSWTSTSASMPSGAPRRSSRAPRSSSSSDSITSTASAPAIRASTTWRGSMKKSLARIGPSNSSRAAARSSSDPPKYCASHSTLSASATPA